jgi:hypothetical protein
LESLWHWTHCFVVGLQIGAAPGHSALFEHSVPQVPVVVSQIGALADLQSELAAHWTHRFVVGLQIGTDVGQSASAEHAAWQVFVAGLQTGVAAGQSVVARHWTQVSVPTLQSAVVPAQAPGSAAVQATQRPSGSSQTGCEPEQFASLVQPTVHVCEVVLHRPFAPVHWVLSRQATQTWAVSSQTGAAPTHSVGSAVVHWTQRPASAPVLTQAGALVARHAAGEPVPRSPSQATQLPAALQIGVAPEHCALELHWTHLFVVALHAGLGETHASVSAAVHSTHMPAPGPVVRQAGAVGWVQAWIAFEPRLPLQPTQTPLWQNGVVPEHCASMMHSTQVWVAPLQTGVGWLQVVKSTHWTH